MLPLGTARRQMILDPFLDQSIRIRWNVERVIEISVWLGCGVTHSLKVSLVNPKKKKYEKGQTDCWKTLDDAIFFHEYLVWYFFWWNQEQNQFSIEKNVHFFPK